MLIVHMIALGLLSGASASDANIEPIYFDTNASYDLYLDRSVAYDGVVNYTAEYPNKVK